jgi:hypothetical protein
MTSKVEWGRIEINTRDLHAMDVLFILDDETKERFSSRRVTLALARPPMG